MTAVAIVHLTQKMKGNSLLKSVKWIWPPKKRKSSSSSSSSEEEEKKEEESQRPRKRVRNEDTPQVAKKVPEVSDSNDDSTDVSDVEVSDVSDVSTDEDSSDDDNDKTENKDSDSGTSSSSGEESSSDDSSSDSDDSDDHEAHLKAKREAAAKKAKEAAAAAAAWTPTPKKNTPGETPEIRIQKGSDGAQAQSSGTPFRRVDDNHWGDVAAKDGGAMADNSYEGAFGQAGFGSRSSEKLLQVRGKRFQHEKTKKKRTFNGFSRAGGAISMESFSTKFNHD